MKIRFFNMALFIFFVSLTASALPDPIKGKPDSEILQKRSGKNSLKPQSSRLREFAQTLTEISPLRLKVQLEDLSDSNNELAPHELRILRFFLEIYENINTSVELDSGSRKSLIKSIALYINQCSLFDPPRPEIIDQLLTVETKKRLNHSIIQALSQIGKEKRRKVERNITHVVRRQLVCLEQIVDSASIIAIDKNEDLPIVQKNIVEREMSIGADAIENYTFDIPLEDVQQTQTFSRLQSFFKKQNQWYAISQLLELRQFCESLFEMDRVNELALVPIAEIDERISQFETEWRKRFGRTVCIRIDSDIAFLNIALAHAFTSESSEYENRITQIYQTQQDLQEKLHSTPDSFRVFHKKTSAGKKLEQLLDQTSN